MNVFTQHFFLVFLSLVTAVTVAQPTADFTSDKTNGCGNLPVQFTDLSTGSPTSWLWDFGDGTPTSTQQHPLHFYSNPGTYTVTLTASNAGGNDTETKIAYITVFPIPLAEFTQDDTSGCIPFAVNFTDLSTSTSSSIVSWLWNFGDGNTSTQNNPQHTYSVPGTYSVSLFSTDGNNCTDDKIKSALITVLDPPDASFDLSSNFSCIIPFNLSIDNNSSTGNGITYLWDFGDNSPTSTLQNPPPHTYSSFGTYIISLVVTNSSGCIDSLADTLTISSFSSDFSAADSSGCAPFTTSFSASNPSITNFSWTFQGGSPLSSGLPNPSVTFNAPGSYDVTLIATNAQQCSDTLTINDFITVFPQPTVSFSASDSEACAAPFTVDFTSVSGGAASWSWIFTGGNPSSSTSQNPSVTYNAEGNYNVSLTVTDTNGCSKTTTVNNFIIIAFPVANFNALPVKGCVPLDVNFTDNSTSNPPVNQWQWNFGDPPSGVNNTSTSQNPSHTYNDTGIYDVQLIITNAEGCTDTLIKTDFVMAGQQPTADFTPKDTSGCHPFTVVFASNSSPYVDEWRWDFGDGSTGSGISPGHTYTDTGYFDVTLIALHHGCADTIIADSAVYVKPAKPVFTSTPSVFCEQDFPYEVTFTDASQGAEDWLWKFGDGSPDFSGQAPPPHTYVAPGFYTAWLIVENFTTGCKDSISATISISKIDVAFSTDTNAGCRPLLVSFSDSTVSNSSITTIKWLFGDGINTPAGSGTSTISGVSNTAGTYSSPKHTYANTGFYDVTLIITNQLGCSDTLIVDSLIDVKPLPVADFSSDTTNGCVPLIIQFSDSTTTSSPLTDWDWDFGNLGTDTIQNPVDTYIVRGQYTVRLIVTDTFNCKDTIVKSNFVNATFPYTNFSMAEDTICNFSLAAFSNTTTGAGLSFTWSFGDNSPPDNSSSPTHTYNLVSDTTVVVDVTLTATDSNGCDSAITRSLIISIPEAGFYAGAQNDSCPPFDASFIDSSSADIINWTWDFGDGTSPIIKTTPNVAHTYEFAGFYDVSVIATNNKGCKDTLEIDSMIRVSGPGGNFTFSLDSSRCFSDVDFVASTFNASSITWDFRDGVTDSNSIVTHRYTTDGAYVPVLILKDTNNCQVFIEASDTIVIITAAISATVTPDTNNVFPETIINFSGASSSPSAVALWEWNFGDGDTLTTTAGIFPKHKFDKSGEYNVSLKITDVDGCMASVVITVTIIEGVITPNIFTPNGDGINDVFTIRRNGMKEHYIVIFNRWGEKIYEHTAPEIMWAGKNFAGENVTDGTYYYILKTTRENGDVIENKNFITLIR